MVYRCAFRLYISEELYGALLIVSAGEQAKEEHLLLIPQGTNCK